MCKVQGGRAADLLPEEVAILDKFVGLPPAVAAAPPPVAAPLPVAGGFNAAFEAALIAEHVLPPAPAPTYTKEMLMHIAATSNVVERLFSRAKLVFTPKRSAMTPATLEMVLFLFCNKDLWDIRTVISAVTAAEDEDAHHPLHDSDDENDAANDFWE